MAYSFSLINGVLLQGQTALGLSGSFRGNGMCMSTRGLRRLPWNKHGLVEDLEYSWSLRLQGETIAFAPDAIVRARMLARGGHAAVDQRCRWEFGRNEVRRQVLVPLLRSHHLSPVRKLAAVIELCMPTLAGLTLLFLVTTLLSLKLFFDPSSDLHRDLLSGAFRIQCSCFLRAGALRASPVFPLLVAFQHLDRAHPRSALHGLEGLHALAPPAQPTGFEPPGKATRMNPL